MDPKGLKEVGLNSPNWSPNWVAFGLLILLSWHETSSSTAVPCYTPRIVAGTKLLRFAD